MALGFVFLAYRMYQSSDPDTLLMLFPAINWANACVLARTIKRPVMRPGANLELVVRRDD